MLAGPYHQSDPAHYAPTENLGGAIDILASYVGVKGKRILVIDAAGDGLIGFLAAGAREAVKVEASYVGSMWARFRTAAFKHLPTPMFSDIMLAWPDRVGRAIHQAYPGVEGHLGDEARAFWKEALKADVMPLFKEWKYDVSDLPYADNKGRGAIDLRRSSIVDSDMETYLSTTEKPFDLIYCSNAFESHYYIRDGRCPTGPQLRELEAQLSLMSRKLHTHGRIAFYVFGDYPSELDNLHAAAAGAGLAMHPCYTGKRFPKGIPSKYADGTSISMRDLVVTFSRP